MAKSDLARYNSFKVRQCLAYEDIQKIATEYANLADDKARTHFTEKYKISDHVFYKVLEFAIVCCIVNDDTRKQIRAKAVSNYKLHNEKEKSKKVMDHYADLYRRRERFFEEAFSKEEIVDISTKYSEGSSLKAIAYEYEICEETVKKLLAKGIVKVITPTSLVFSIRKRAQKEGRSMASFARLETARELTRSRALKPFADEIQMLEFQLSHYDQYFDGDECSPTKEYLEARLEIVNRKYEKWLDF